MRLPPSPNDQARPSVRMEGRYLQDTAVKLGDDASYDLEKATERSMMSTPPTITPPKSRLSSNREDEKLMRSSFLAEASDCIRSLQAVFQSANASTCFSRLDDWRRTDLRATAQMQQHVKTLQSLNNSVAEFLQRCSAVETFQDFHSTMDRLSEAVCEMRDFRSEFTSTIDTIAKGVADRVLASLSKDAEERSAWLHCQLEKHGEVSSGATTWINGWFSDVGICTWMVPESSHCYVIPPFLLMFPRHSTHSTSSPFGCSVWQGGCLFVLLVRCKKALRPLNARFGIVWKAWADPWSSS